MSKGYSAPSYEIASLSENNRACQGCLRDSEEPKADFAWVLPMANTNYTSPLPVKEGMAAIRQARTNFERVFPANDIGQGDKAAQIIMEVVIFSCLIAWCYGDYAVLSAVCQKFEKTCEVSPYYGDHHTTVWEDYSPPGVMDLMVGDLVYFLQRDSKLAREWILGMVEEISKGRDGVLREVTVKYCNSSDQKLSLTGDSSKEKTLPRSTIRTVRKMAAIVKARDIFEWIPHYDGRHTTVWEDYPPPGVISLDCECQPDVSDQLGQVNVPHVCPEILKVEEWDTMANDYWGSTMDFATSLDKKC